ncbi:Uncharacterised protein [Candidatus Tiddalikarchaeum anstoanum]|nr:Uncharacterised protein [Candidatus Tiddalikarchaeum anstoanum]
MNSSQNDESGLKLDVTLENGLKTQMNLEDYIKYLAKKQARHKEPSTKIGQLTKRHIYKTLTENLEEEPLIIIHPGWKNYGSDGFNYMNSFSGYEDYITALKEEISKQAKKGTTFIFYDVEKKNSLNTTKETINIESEKLFYIPSRSSMSIKEYDFDEDFFKKVSNVAPNIKLAGEWRYGCITHYAYGLQNIFQKITMLENLIFPPKKNSISQ